MVNGVLHNSLLTLGSIAHGKAHFCSSCLLIDSSWCFAAIWTWTVLMRIDGLVGLAFSALPLGFEIV